MECVAPSSKIRASRRTTRLRSGATSRSPIRAMGRARGELLEDTSQRQRFVKGASMPATGRATHSGPRETAVASLLHSLCSAHRREAAAYLPGGVRSTQDPLPCPPRTDEVLELSAFRRGRPARGARSDQSRRSTRPPSVAGLALLRRIAAPRKDRRRRSPQFRAPGNSATIVMVQRELRADVQHRQAFRSSAKRAVSPATARRFDSLRAFRLTIAQSPRRRDFRWANFDASLGTAGACGRGRRLDFVPSPRAIAITIATPREVVNVRHGLRIATLCACVKPNRSSCMAHSPVRSARRV
jgi:hypothetical protein